MNHSKNTRPDLILSNQSITERVFAGLVNRPDEIVLTDGVTGREFTAKAFMDAVKALAGGLSAQGFGKDATVALTAANSPDFCVAFHAIAWAGGTITTFNPTNTASEINHQLNDSRAEFLITDSVFLDTVREGMYSTKVRDLSVIGQAEEVQSLDEFYGDPITEQVPVDVNNHSVVLPYSSGTTGLPKGVRLSHQNLVVNVDQIAVGGDFQPGEVTACFLRLFHIFGMTGMNLHLAEGDGLVTMPRFDLELFLKISRDYKALRMWVVPPVALAFAKHLMIDDFDLSAMDQVVCGAAPMGKELSDAATARLGCEMCQAYGVTELSPATHITPLSAPRSGSSGLALPNTQCHIVDTETGQDLPAGERGELWIKGPQVMLGYLNNEKATTEMILHPMGGSRLVTSRSSMETVTCLSLIA